MASTPGNRSGNISEIRQAGSQLLDAVDKLNALRATWDGGMSTWVIDASGDDPAAEGYNPHDFAGSNAGLMKADIAAVIGTTLDAVNALMAAGHRTNLEKARL
jgi:hypothetical protein